MKYDRIFHDYFVIIDTTNEYTEISSEMFASIQSK